MNKVLKRVAGLVLTGALCVLFLNANAQRGGAIRAGMWGPGTSIGFGWGGGYGWGGFGYWPWWGPGWGMGFYPGYYNKPYTGRGFNDWGYPNEGFQLGAMPAGFYPFYFNNTLYYYVSGAYYTPNDTGGYTVANPPLGAEVPSLNKNAHSVVINGAQYFESRGIYYSTKTNTKGQTVYVVTGREGVLNTNNGVVSLPAVGTTVNKLPEGSSKITLKGVNYFVSPDGVYYEALVKDDKTIYRVASVPSEADYN